MSRATNVTIVLNAKDDASKIITALNKSLGQSGDVFKQVAAHAVGFGAAIAAFQGAQAIFSGVSGAVVGMNSTLETATNQFAQLMGDTDMARDHVRGLFEFAKDTPFETGPIIEASRIMETFGGAALNSKENLQLFGDAAAGTSAPLEEVASWSSRLYAALQAGRPFGEAAQRLGELAVLTPQARNEMQKMQEQGKNGAEIWKRYQSELGRFSGSMGTLAGTWSGLTSTFSDTVNLLVADTFRPFFEFLKAGLTGVNKAFDNQEMKDAISGFQAVVAAAFGGSTEAVRDFAESTLNRAAGFISESMGTIGQVVYTAIRAVGEIFGTIPDILGDVLSAFGAMTQGVGEVLGHLVRGVDGFMAGLTVSLRGSLSGVAGFLEAIRNLAYATGIAVSLLGNPVLGVALAAAGYAAAKAADDVRGMAAQIKDGGEGAERAAASMAKIQAGMDAAGRVGDRLAATGDRIRQTWENYTPPTLAAADATERAGGAARDAAASFAENEKSQKGAADTAEKAAKKFADAWDDAIKLQNRAFKDIENGARDAEASLIALGEAVGHSINVEIAGATASIAQVQRDAARSIQEAIGSVGRSRTVDAQKKGISDRQEAEDRAFRARQESDNREYELKKDLAKATTSEERAEIQRRFEEVTIDLSRRRSQEDAYRQFRVAQEASMRAFEHRLEDENLQLAVARIKSERDSRIQGINEALTEKQRLIQIKADEEMRTVVALMQAEHDKIRETWTEKIPDLWEKGGEAMKGITDEMTSALDRDLDESMAKVRKLLAELAKVPGSKITAPGSSPGGPPAGYVADPNTANNPPGQRWAYRPGSDLDDEDNWTTYHRGGQVPGPRGMEVPVLALGGEKFAGPAQDMLSDRDVARIAQATAQAMSGVRLEADARGFALRVRDELVRAQKDMTATGIA